MDSNLIQLKTDIYNKCGFEISDFKIETESKEYYACQYKLNGHKIISRSAKITPKKVGQFVTFWKRSINGPIEPFHESDELDFFVVNVRTETSFGQFVFPKSVMIKKGIISTKKKEGKRAFRVYPSWMTPNNKQAEQSQKWQLEYFFEINQVTDLENAEKLYKSNSR